MGGSINSTKLKRDTEQFSVHKRGEAFGDTCIHPVLPDLTRFPNPFRQSVEPVSYIHRVLTAFFF